MFKSLYLTNFDAQEEIGGKWNRSQIKVYG